MKTLVLTILLITTLQSFAQYDEQMGGRKLDSAEVPKSFPATPDSLINSGKKLDSHTLKLKTELFIDFTNKFAIRTKEEIPNYL